MILDRFNEFSDAQAETTVATHASDSVVDLGSSDILKFDAESKRLRFHCTVQTACTSDGSATVVVKLETDSDVDFGSATNLFTSSAIPVASLVAGYQFVPASGLILPSGCERYLRVTYTIGTAALTAGKFDAYLSNDADTNEF